MRDRSSAGPTPRRGPTPAVWVATALIALSCGWAVVTGVSRMIQGAAGFAAPVGPGDPRPLFNPFWVGLFEVMLAAFLLGCQYLAAFRQRVAHSLIVAVLFILSGVVIVCLGDPGSAIEMTVGGAHLFAGVVMGRWGWRLMRRRRDNL